MHGDAWRWMELFERPSISLTTFGFIPRRRSAVAAVWRKMTGPSPAETILASAVAVRMVRSG
jgi:hypothetical protein